MILLPSEFWEVKETKRKGKGVFAKKDIGKHKLVAQYIGKLVHIKDVDLEKYREYLMEYDDERAIVPDVTSIGAHLVNHSCNPNCWIYKYNRNVFLASMRDIAPGEEITIHYLLPPKGISCKDNCEHICNCGESDCTGTMHLSEEDYKTWQKIVTSLD
jgi:SET domain-containing protein